MHIPRCRAQNPPAGLTKRIYIKLYIKKKKEKNTGRCPETQPGASCLRSASVVAKLTSTGRHAT